MEFVDASFGSVDSETGEIARGNPTRLYFDLLNYSEFVSRVDGLGQDESLESGEVDVGDGQSGYGLVGKPSGITGFFVNLFNGFLGLTGRVVDTGYGAESEIDLVSVKALISNMSSSELDVIAEGAKIEVEDSEFEIEVNESKAIEHGVDYKWGYKVMLKDLKFMAKIDITSDEVVSVIDDSSLKVGNKILSFKDLVDSGYDVRIERPELGIGNFSSTVTENVTEVIESNVTVEEVESEINDTEVVEVVEDEDGEDDEDEGEKVKEKKEKEEKEKKDKKDKDDEQTGYGKKVETGYGIVGNVIRAITGFVVNAVSSEVEDIKYANTVSVYVERDFEGDGNNIDNKRGQIDFEDIDLDGRVSVGDIIFLDPSLIIINITKAEHLDSNRSFISDIYEEVREKDDNWSEAINEREYVRVTFEQALDSTKDITVYARVISECDIGANSVMINGTEVLCDIYEKKKRIDELRNVLEAENE